MIPYFTTGRVKCRTSEDDRPTFVSTEAIAYPDAIVSPIPHPCRGAWGITFRIPGSG
jgi:hypothetical protein